MTGASANGDGLLDLEAAADAAASEAERTPFTFAYKGRKYELPPHGGWSVKALRATAAGDLQGALGELLGKEFDQLCDAGGNRRRTEFLVYLDRPDGRYTEPPKFITTCAARFDPDVEALMLEVYGVDVLDPSVSTRRVAVLLERLPPYARRPGEHWSTEAELLAVLADQLAELTWVTLRAAGAKGAPRPRPLPRPAPARILAPQAAPQAPAAAAPPGSPVKAGSWAEAAAMLGGMRGMRRRDGE